MPNEIATGIAAEIDFIAWAFLAIGLYSAAAGIGELRQPGFWVSMVQNIIDLPALRFLTGMYCLAIGTVLYLLAPWDFSDWMLVVVKVIGAWMVAEGVLFLGFGDWMLKLSAKVMGAATRIWAMFSILLGLGMIVAALLRM